MPDYLESFIKRTRNKYPDLARSGYIWICNMSKSEEVDSFYYRPHRMLKTWTDKRKLCIVGMKKGPELPAYFLNGKVDKNSYPVFFEMGDEEILNKLGYNLPIKIIWAGRNMTKTKEKIDRFDLMDLD
ncbi:unnamed protein product [marine sediment metagenome]|uniref:Uncharacterized protein n=1 Tax=marine sediment metagenome TaxID=412755 RepID=X0XNK4_9ZZZZ